MRSRSGRFRQPVSTRALTSRCLIGCRPLHGDFRVRAWACVSFLILIIALPFATLACTLSHSLGVAGMKLLAKSFTHVNTLDISKCSIGSPGGAAFFEQQVEIPSCRVYRMLDCSRGRSTCGTRSSAGVRMSGGVVSGATVLRG